MLLAIDIGNTQVVMGVFSDGEMIASWRIATWPQRTADECWAQVLAMFQAWELSVGGITDAAISSVAPAITSTFKRMTTDWMGIDDPYILRPEEYDFIEIKYDQSRSVGADRICNAVAGYEMFGGPLVIVDFGTATTFDVVDEQGNYLGGAIMPGLETSTAELFKKAARLFKVGLRFPETVIGQSTETSIQAGIMYGAIDSVDGIARRIWRELGQECKVIATGGLAPVIVKRSGTVSETVPFLVLKGLNRIYHQVRG